MSDETAALLKISNGLAIEGDQIIVQMPVGWDDSHQDECYPHARAAVAAALGRVVVIGFRVPSSGLPSPAE